MSLISVTAVGTCQLYSLPLIDDALLGSRTAFTQRPPYNAAHFYNKDGSVDDGSEQSYEGYEDYEDCRELDDSDIR